MNIGVDATCWHNMRGYGRHARALLSTLVQLDSDNHYTFFFDSVGHTTLPPSEAEVQVVGAKKPTAEAASADGNRSIMDMWRMSKALSRRDFDVVLFPTIYSFVPVWSRARVVVGIHDMIAEKFPELTLPRFRARLFWRAKVGLGRKQADAILTVSEYSRKCIAEHFKISPESIYVVGEAGDPIFRVIDDPQPTSMLQVLGIQPGNRYVVYVGGFGPHKNLEMLVRAFAQLSSDPQLSDVKLVLVGEHEKETFYSHAGRLKHHLDQLGLRDRVIFTGFLPDEDLVILLNLSDVLVLPSFMEGFGLPAVEAAACGCPVVATTESPLPQLLGDGGLYINPYDGDALERALRRVLESEQLQQQMSRAGRAAAGALTWEKAAFQLMDVFQNVTARASNYVNTYSPEKATFS